jgi:excisionase family DNA binding protein
MTPPWSSPPPAPIPEDTTNAPQTITPVLYRPTQAARVLNLSRSVVFDLLRTGRLRSVKEGRLRLIPASAIRDYVELLEKEAA